MNFHLIAWIQLFNIYVAFYVHFFQNVDLRKEAIQLQEISLLLSLKALFLVIIYFVFKEHGYSMHILIGSPFKITEGIFRILKNTFTDTLDKLFTYN